MPISDDKSSQQYNDASGDGDNQLTNDESSDDDMNNRKKDGTRMKYEISSNLGPYWCVQIETESTPATDMVMAMLTDYSNLSASPNTPQYEFRKGMEIFKEDGYEATVSKLKDNLVGRGCINMLGKNEITG